MSKIFFCHLFSDICHLNGGVAQLGERLPCTQEVIGSIPFTSTSIRGQRTEDRGQRSEDRRQRSEDSELVVLSLVLVKEVLFLDIGKFRVSGVDSIRFGTAPGALRQLFECSR